MYVRNKDVLDVSLFFFFVVVNIKDAVFSNLGKYYGRLPPDFFVYEVRTSSDMFCKYYGRSRTFYVRNKDFLDMFFSFL